MLNTRLAAPEVMGTIDDRTQGNLGPTSWFDNGLTLDWHGPSCKEINPNTFIIANNNAINIGLMV